LKLDVSRRAGEEAQLQSGGVEMGDPAEPGLQEFTSQVEIPLSSALSLLDASYWTKTGPEESSPNLKAFR